MRYEFYGCDASTTYTLHYPAVISLALTPPLPLIVSLGYQPTFLQADTIWSGGFIPWNDAGKL